MTKRSFEGRERVPKLLADALRLRDRVKIEENMKGIYGNGLQEAESDVRLIEAAFASNIRLPVIVTDAIARYHA